jgi:tetratricopeptide (TPR) repeat protein
MGVFAGKMGTGEQMGMQARVQKTELNQIEIDQAKKLMAARQFSQALVKLLPIVQSGVQDLEVMDSTATCFYQLGDADTAIKLFEVAAETWPDVAQVWGKLAAFRHSAGDKAGAIAGYQRRLKLEPNSVNSMVALNLLAPFDRNSSKASKLHAFLTAGKLSPKETKAVHNALGRIEERSGRYKEAFLHFSKAKQAEPASYDPAVYEAKLSGLEQKYFPVPRGEPKGDGPVPVFVTGMPRSGTTLVENCLLGHSQTFSVGESPALSECFSALYGYLARQGRSSGAWDWCGQLTAEEIAAFRKLYFEKALAKSPLKAEVMIDKMPLNCFYIGLAQVLFPEAHFVFMSRHPLDIGLSNFMTNFQNGNEFSRRLDWLGHAILCVYRSAREYRTKLGDQLRIQSFDALVSDPEAQIPLLVEQLGLGWEDGCLSPEDNLGAVRTASMDQVREKINTKGLGKWRRYEEQLQPLVDALGGQDWLDQWQVWDRQAALTGSFD